MVCKLKEPHPATALSSVLCCRAQELPEAELGDPWARPRSRCPAVHRPQRPFHPEVCWSSTDSVGQILVAPVVTSDGYPDKLSEQCEAKGCSSVLSIKPCQALRRKKKVLKVTHLIKCCVRLSLRGRIQNQTSKAKIAISVLPWF